MKAAAALLAASVVAGVLSALPYAAAQKLAAEQGSTETETISLTASIEVTDEMMTVIQLPAVVANEDYAVLGGFLGGLVLLAIYLVTLRLIDAQYLRVNRKDREAAIGGFLGADRRRRRKHGPGMKYSPLDRHDGSAARGYSDSDDGYDDRNGSDDYDDDDSDRNRGQKKNKKTFAFRFGNNRRDREREREKKQDNRARDRGRRARNDEDDEDGNNYERPRNGRYNMQFVHGHDEPSVWKREKSPPGSGQRGRYSNDSDRDEYDDNRRRRAAHRDPYERTVNSPRSQPRRGGRRYASDEEMDEDPRMSRRPSSRSGRRRSSPNVKVQYSRGAYRGSDYQDDDDDDLSSPPLPPR